MYLPTLTDDELIRYTHATEDALVTSDLERELVRRLESREDERLAILDQQDLETAEELTAFFEKVSQLKAYADDL